MKRIICAVLGFLIACSCVGCTSDSQKDMESLAEISVTDAVAEKITTALEQIDYDSTENDIIVEPHEENMGAVTTSTDITVTEPEPVQTKILCSSEYNTYDLDMPNPMSYIDTELSAKDFPFYFFSHKLHCMSYKIYNNLEDGYVNEAELYGWLISTSSAEAVPQAYYMSSYCNAYNFINDFNIPAVAVRKALENNRTIVDEAYGKYEYTITDEDIDVLCSLDEARIIEYFADENSIVKGACVYTPAWVYYHNQKGYELAELPADELVTMLPKYKNLLTDEAYDALSFKISCYSKNEN